VANDLQLEDLDVSPSGVCGVWLRHDLETRHKSPLKLGAGAQEQTAVLSDEQIRLMERPSPEFRMRQVEPSALSELLNQDTIYWGQLKGVGKIYIQVVIHAFCSLAFAKLYPTKMSITNRQI
jgi:hypothetical protein